jgi:hypothetical protein
MKHFLLLLSMVGSLVASAAGAEPSLDLESTPLPSGPLVNRVSNNSQWTILFSYEEQTPPNNSGSPTSGKAGGRPQTIAVTETRPIWHGLQTNQDGQKTDCWFDGYMYFITGFQGIPAALDMSVRGAMLPRFFDRIARNQFPDFDWVSPTTYIGTQKGTTYWVFRNGSGTTAWVDFNSRNPARWQSGGEVRTFQFSPSPSEKLGLPPDVAKLSKEGAYFRRIISDTIPRGG